MLENSHWGVIADCFKIRGIPAKTPWYGHLQTLEPKNRQTPRIPNLNGNVLCRTNSDISLPLFRFASNSMFLIEFKTEKKIGRKNTNPLQISHFHLNYALPKSANSLGSNIHKEPYHGAFTNTPQISKPSAITPQW